MYFVNHRSWADFFVDGCNFLSRVTRSDMISNSSYLSRMAVIFAFPPACLCGYLLQFVWFFKRQRGISREWFTSFFKKNWAIRFSCFTLLMASPNSGVIVYPEGHRFKGEGTLNLKTGVMEVAYNLGVPCQIVLSNGKEKLMDEISLQINKHQLITICVSDVLDPTQFKTKEEWFEYVREQWKKTYEQLNQGEPEGEPFFAPLPGLKKEQEEESLPLKRRTIASVFAAAIVAVTAIVVRVILRFL